MKRARGLLIAWLAFWSLAFVLLTAVLAGPRTGEVFAARKAAQMALVAGTAALAWRCLRSQR